MRERGGQYVNSLAGIHTLGVVSPMPRPAGPTRRRILDAAYELFYRKGYSRVGVDEIAAFAGLTKRTLYYHFESKDQLLGSVLALHSELALARVLK